MAYQVIVGNIGTVYDGGKRKAADNAFRSYKNDSRFNYGRASGEDVTLFCDGEPIKEWLGSKGKKEDAE